MLTARPERIARRALAALAAVVMAGCPRVHGGQPTPARVEQARAELARAEQLLPSAAYDPAAARDVKRLLENAEPVLRRGDPAAWPDTQIAFGRYWLAVKQPSLAERVERAQQRFAAAEQVLAAPHDAAKLASIHAWSGMAEMQLSQAGLDPRSHFQRARDHFAHAKQLWESVDDEPDSEAMEQLIRRVDDEWRRALQ